MNGYPDRFTELLDALPDDARVLDCGSGPRHHDDPRVQTFDLDGADICGDIMAMSMFPSGTFDLILSQAVLEHLPDPRGAVLEMIRVLKPGGTIYAEVAFFQPYHPVPGHYFNMTEAGIGHIFRGIEIQELGSSGSLWFIVKWFGEMIQAADKVGLEEWFQVLNTFDILDEKLDHDERRAIAPVVYLTGVKR